ncbi:hypothetical protein QQZ08_006438 [Neonectria magnoliae]|uniref:Uncharacterized protein n=1 Tax=Neonectria magnoliae TaxID=2732573 RepID=A0ABR1I114_9HYPO
MVHQEIYVVARVCGYYRRLAVVKHINSASENVIRTCLRLIAIFSEPSNRLALKQELAMAVDFFENGRPPGQVTFRLRDPSILDEDLPCPFPFITTCLFLGAGYQATTGQVHRVKELPHDIPYHSVRDTSGMTVLNITDLENIQYCFVLPGHVPQTFHDQFHRPITGWEYHLGHYRSNDEARTQNTSAVALDRVPLLPVSVFHELWPSPISGTPPYREPLKHGPLTSLRHQAAAKLFQHMLSNPEFDLSLLEEVKAMPGFQRLVKEYLLANPDQVGIVPTSGYLLEIAFAGDTSLEWHLFPNLSSKALKVAFSGEGFSGVIEISLPPPSAPDTPGEFVKALSALGSLDTLQILDHPARMDDTMSLELYNSLVLSAPNLVKRKLVLTGPYSCGLREKLWLPMRDGPKALPAFPVLQMLMIHGETMDEELDYCLYLGDAFLNPVKFVLGFLQFIWSIFPVDPVLEVSDQIAMRTFSRSPPSLDHDSISDIGPIPAEINAVSNRNVQMSSNLLCPMMRDLTPGTWTVMLLRMGNGIETTHFEYAFIRSKSDIQVAPETWRGTIIMPPEIEVISIEEFLKLTAPGIDSSKVSAYLDKTRRSLSARARGNRPQASVEERPPIRLLDVEKVCKLLTTSITREWERANSPFDVSDAEDAMEED